MPPEDTSDPHGSSHTMAVAKAQSTASSEHQDLPPNKQAGLADTSFTLSLVQCFSSISGI